MTNKTSHKTWKESHSNYLVHLGKPASEVVFYTSKNKMETKMKLLLGRSEIAYVKLKEEWMIL